MIVLFEKYTIYIQKQFIAFLYKYIIYIQKQVIAFLYKKYILSTYKNLYIVIIYACTANWS